MHSDSQNIGKCGVPGCSRNMGQPDILLEIRSWSLHRIRNLSEPIGPVRKDILWQSTGSFFEKYRIDMYRMYKVPAVGTVTNDGSDKRDERSGTKCNEVFDHCDKKWKSDEIGWNRPKSESSQSFSGTFSSEGLRGSGDVQKLWKGSLTPRPWNFHCTSYITLHLATSKLLACSVVYTLDHFRNLSLYIILYIYNNCI